MLCVVVNTLNDMNIILKIALGLGMYESPLFLAAHDDESGGRSVPTTPLQVAAPGSQSDHLSVDHKIAFSCFFFLLFF